MRLLKCFDSGVLPPARMSNGQVIIDVRPTGSIMNVLVIDAPDPLRVSLLVEGKAGGFIVGQGLLVSRDGGEFRPVSVERVGPNELRAAVEGGGEFRLATRYPYGRDALDRLICETRGASHLRVRLLERDHRMLPVFEFRQADNPEQTHFLIAGEDAWETAGSWVADAMVRLLCRDAYLARTLLARSAVCVVPLASPYSAGQPAGSYTTLDGRGIYGAATWTDPIPPPEYGLIRAEVEEAIRARRLGLMLTIHSWQAQQPHTEIETIRSSGGNALSEARLQWAERTLEALMRDVPLGRTRVAEKIWHPGLARDHLLSQHNAVTFRIEITTAGQGYEGFRATGEQILRNLAIVHDWASACEA
jgi:hypothetical protein